MKTIIFAITIAILTLAACQPAPEMIGQNPNESGGSTETIHATCDRTGFTYDLGIDDPNVLAKVRVVDDKGAEVPGVSFSGSVLKIASCLDASACCADGMAVTIEFPSSSDVEAWVVECATAPVGGDYLGGVEAWHDFGTTDPAVLARVVAFAPVEGSTSSNQTVLPAFYGSVANVGCNPNYTGVQVVTFVLLP